MSLLKIDRPRARFGCGRITRIVVAASLLACAPALPASDAHPLLDSAPTSRTEQTLDGKDVVLPAPGQVTVIDVWQTSCVPCVRMMPALEQLSRARADRVRFIGVAVDDNPGLVLQKLQERGITYPNIIDASWSVKGWLRVDRVPATLVFDTRGKVRWVHSGSGEGDIETLRQVVDALLGEGVRT